MSSDDPGNLAGAGELAAVAFDDRPVPLRLAIPHLRKRLEQFRNREPTTRAFPKVKVEPTVLPDIQAAPYPTKHRRSSRLNVSYISPASLPRRSDAPRAATARQGRAGREMTHRVGTIAIGARIALT
jgi:hypothetical protein